LKTWQQRQPFLQAKTAFVRAAIAGTWPWGQPRDALKAAMVRENIVEEYHDDLLKMTLGSLTEERVTSLEHELKKCADQISYFTSVTLDTLFIHDLDTLEQMLPRFWKFRDDSNAVW
jgi:hypothetical protein